MFDNMFKDESDIATEALTDEFDDFISRPPETKKACPDPMRWWYENREQYPHFSRMALDYLSIPSIYYYVIINSIYTSLLTDVCF